MANKNNKNKRVIMVCISSAICVGLVIGSFFLGYNIGSSQTSESNEVELVNNPNSYPEFTLVGTYRRTFYNNYNNSVESYVVLKDDNTCKYIDEVASEYAVTVDLTTTDKNCTYSYDENSKIGEIDIKMEQYILNDDGTKERLEPKTKTLKFNYDSGSFLLGGATYYRVR